jgi:hypothetical protein
MGLTLRERRKPGAEKIGRDPLLLEMQDVDCRQKDHTGWLSWKQESQARN